jgi:hypothetical protein
VRLDEAGVVFNQLFLTRTHNILGELLPEFGHIAETLRVIDVPRETNGQILRILMNADLEQAVGFLSMARQAVAAPSPEIPTELADVGRSSDDHWRWRFRMATRIASLLDAQRYGVVALYLFGSTKNATAGPGSDIDLLVHFRGGPEQREELRLWFAGWGQALAEMNFLRTGYRTDSLLEVHFVGDDEIDRHGSFATRIDAITDPARPLALGTALKP